jgi:hypothetical protein
MDFVNVPLLIDALPYNVHVEHWPVVSSLFNMFQHILIQFFLVENFGKFLLIILKFQNKSTLTLPTNETIFHQVGIFYYNASIGLMWVEIPTTQQPTG